MGSRSTPVAAPPVFEEGRAPTGAKRRLLLVDDEINVLEALAPWFRKNYEVVTRSSPEAALALLAENPDFVAIVSDLRMPHMDGIEFLAEARRFAPKARRLLLTGYADLQAALSAVNDAGIHRLLTKPCPGAEVARAVDEAIAAVNEDQPPVDGRIASLERRATAGAIAGAIGQEIGNLVTALSSSLGMMEQQADDGETVRADDFKLLAIVKNRLLEHTQALKQLAKPRELGHTTFDTSAFVCRTTDMLKKTGMLKVARVNIDLPLEALFVEGDPVQLEGVLINLLKNAAEALQENEARVVQPFRLDEEMPSIHVIVEPIGEEAVSIVVEDNGRGMLPQTRKRLFEPYFTTKSPSGGTGLGLAIARDIVERHGGQLTAESTMGRGSRFSIALPRAGCPPLPKRVSSSVHPLPLRR